MIMNSKYFKIVNFSVLVLTPLFFHYWNAKLISFLTSRKTDIPFRTAEDLFINTNKRIALIPGSNYVIDFKESTYPVWQKIYKDRIEPHLEEYESYPHHLTDMTYFIKDDFDTAYYDYILPVR